jgi:hypothetical protein
MNLELLAIKWVAVDLIFASEQLTTSLVNHD